MIQHILHLQNCIQLLIKFLSLRAQTKTNFATMKLFEISCSPACPLHRSRRLLHRNSSVVSSYFRLLSLDWKCSDSNLWPPGKIYSWGFVWTLLSLHWSLVKQMLTTFFWWASLNKGGGQIFPMGAKKLLRQSQLFHATYNCIRQKR